jgi:hypothetical protein
MLEERADFLKSAATLSYYRISRKLAGDATIEWWLPTPVGGYSKIATCSGSKRGGDERAAE